MTRLLAGALLAGLGLAAAAGAASAGPNCTCRAADGQKFEQGHVMCIRGRLARCEMLLNNPTWKIIADSCPQADISPLRLPVARPGSALSRSSPPSCSA